MLMAFCMLIPEEAYGLILLGIILALFLGLISGARAYALAVLLCLMIALGPFLEVLIDHLPDWAFLLLCLWFAISIIGFVFGKRVMENVLSMLLFSLLALPWRIVRRLLWPGRISRR